MDINSILFAIAAGDATAVILLGIVSALLVLLGFKADEFFSRVWPATLILVGTSLGAGVLLWGANYFFGG